MARSTALRYFEATKHPSPVRHANVMDWSNRPDAFKVYEGRERLPLPRPRPLNVPALDAVAAADADPSGGRPSLEDLARLLVHGAGVRHTRSSGTDVFHFRTYASAGALYPVEVYVACAELSGLPAGVYHFGPREPALVKLHEGDRRMFLLRAAGDEPTIAAAPVLLILTGIPWRTSWKYTERGYRHLFWDAGMILANVLALAVATGQPARVVLGFADSEVEALLGLDGRTEFPLALVAVGTGAGVEPSSQPSRRATFVTAPLSRNPIEYPMITEVNDAGRLSDPAEVAEWRGEPEALSAPRDRTGPAAMGPGIDRPSDDLQTVIRRRGSAREFSRAAIPAPVLGDILNRATRGIPTDYQPSGSRLIEPFLIANRVDGLDPGAYVFRGGLRAIRRGDFRREAGLLCLGQSLGAQAAATHFLMADLGRMIEALGDRGYRAAELEAGITAGKMYLGAYGHRLGATGLTFLDDPVAEFFSPESSNRNCLLVVAIGESPRLGRTVP